MRGTRDRAGAGSPQLAQHERVLLRESAADGTEYLGTNHALYHRNPIRAEHGWRRVGWAQVQSVQSSRTSRTVTLRLWPEAACPVVSLRVGEHSRLPGFATERVTSCQVTSQQVRITDTCAATMTAQRDPASGDITWTVRLGAGCDRADPELAPAIDDVLGELRAQLGC